MDKKGTILLTLTGILLLLSVVVLMMPSTKQPIVRIPVIVNQPTDPATTTNPLPSATQGEKVKISDTTVGTGVQASTGDTVSVHYIGTLTDGQEFDQSYTRGEPLTFTLGAGQMIAGFDQGVQGMKVGGKRILTVPPELAYGDQARGDIIKANSTLVFTVELIDVKKAN